MLQNNGFQGDNASLTAYATIGGVALSIDSSTPLSNAIPKTLKVAVPSGASGQVGFSNSGYLGVPVSGGNYSSFFWVKGLYTGEINVSLNGPSGKVYGSAIISVQSTTNKFTYYETTFASLQSYESDNSWRLTFDASKVQGSGLNFAMVQLFPATYHAR